MRARRITLFFSASLVVSMVASILLLRNIDQIRPKASIEDVLYVDSPKLIQRTSLGFNGLMACIYWTRTVQYFGHRHYSREMSYNELAPLLEITTALDPHLLPTYQFGASFLAPPPPDGAGEPQRAIQLMEYGIQHNPDSWQLYYEFGFVYYTELHDYKKAAEVFARGADVPGAHPFLRIMAAQTAQHAGELETARMLWAATYQTSHETNIRQNALEHLRAIKVDEDVTRLEEDVTRFGKRTGRLPGNMAELVAAEHLPGLPVDPDGNPYQLDAQGRVLLEHPDDFPFVTRGLPPGYKPSGPLRFHSNS